MIEGLNQGMATATQTVQPAPQPRLIRAAHEFEAQMLKELLKPLEQSDSLAGDDNGEVLGSAGALGDFAAESLGRAISERGGLGIARCLIHALSRSETASGTGEVIGK